MSHAPLVTIGIPCYNGAAWLRQAIDSALAQTHPAVELIVVDDGSSDNSILQAGAYGDRLTLRRTNHRGATFARNIVLEEARGDWVQYLDADDYLEPHKIATQLAEATSDDGTIDADVLYAPVWIEQETGPNQGRTLSALDPGLDLPSRWLTWQLPQTGGALWRREALQGLGGWRPDQPCCQEHELYLRAIQAGLRFRQTTTPGAVYRIWSEATLCRKDPRLVIRTKTKLIDSMRDWLKAKKQWTAAQAALAGRVCFEMARSLARENLREARRYYRERKREGMLRLEGPAAPLSYRVVHGLLGFTAAERMAQAVR